MANILCGESGERSKDLRRSGEKSIQSTGGLERTEWESHNTGPGDLMGVAQRGESFCGGQRGS